jgi:hypothetical protein
MLPLLEIERLFGLPAHPLLVHGAVVLVPLAAVAMIGSGLRESWRRAYYLPVTLLAMAGGAFAFLSSQSGEPLSESVRHAGKRVGEHPEEGDTAMVFAMIFAGACLVLYLAHRFGPRIRKEFNLPTLPVSYDTILYAAAVPFALLALFTMIVAGHSGAELVWKTNA